MRPKMLSVQLNYFPICGIFCELFGKLWFILQKDLLPLREKCATIPYCNQLRNLLQNIFKATEKVIDTSSYTIEVRIRV